MIRAAIVAASGFVGGELLRILLGNGSRRLYAVAALDVNGAAGNAVQCLDVRMGRPERAGHGFPGLRLV